MSAAGPRREGRRRNCPAWCEVNHAGPLDLVHRGVVAGINRGGNTVMITVVSDPRRPGPVVAIDARDIEGDSPSGLFLSPADASGLAGVLAVLGVDDLAGYLRHAADLLSEGGSGGAS